jgi:hypothetical protein
MTTITKKINQIYKKVDDIAKRGKDGYLDYFSYLNELVDQGQWSLFDDMMLKKYQIDISKYRSIDEVKKETFDKVRFFTLDQFQKELQDLYNSQGVYQNSFNVYKLSDNEFLGQIYEIEVMTESSDFNRSLELLTKQKIITYNLEVHKSGTITLIDDAEITLIEKYAAALDILLS